MASRARAAGQQGFTLIEVLVGITILLIGVLGVVSLVGGAAAVTSKTRAREAGTNVARSIVEVARSVPYRDLTTDSLLVAIDSRSGLSDTDPGGAYVIESRGVDYALTLKVCSLDNPKDYLGVHEEGIEFCSDSDAPGAGDVVRDRNPDDYKRVRVTLQWSTRGAQHSITQTSAIINPVGGLGPSVIALTMTSPTSSSNPLEIEGSGDPDLAPTQATFVAQTSVAAATVDWSVGGSVQGQATAGDSTNRSWDFTWDLVDSGGDPIFYDCTYVVQADAEDEQGRAGAPRAETVILNRQWPLAVKNLDGGRNGKDANGDGNQDVDLQWSPSPECDVLGYRVYRSTDSTSWTQITCFGQTKTYVEKAKCVDDSAPSADPLHYRVLAVDVAPDGTLRESGETPTELTVSVGSNTVPTVPQNLTFCIGGELGCTGADGDPAPSGVLVLRWDAAIDAEDLVPAFYRIYRDGSSYADRHDVFFHGTGVIAWIEPDLDGSSHDYRVSAVDGDFGESGLSGAVTAP